MRWFHACARRGSVPRKKLAPTTQNRPPAPHYQVMRTSLLLLAWFGGTALADPRAAMKNGHYADHEKAWARFAVLGTRLGAPLEAQAGFTCGPPPGTDGFTTQNHSCVKFLDDRCKSRPAKIHHVRTSGDLPKGQTCFMDEFTGATYLDRAFTAPPLRAVRIVGTDTSKPLVFRIEYTFAADDLTPDSNLGKALIAKYGTPSYTNAPTQMSWELGDVQVAASCRTIGGDHKADGEYCTLRVEDNKLDSTERDIQSQANDDARTTTAPPAPPL